MTDGPQGCSWASTCMSQVQRQTMLGGAYRDSGHVFGAEQGCGQRSEEDW